MNEIIQARNYFRRILNPLGFNEWRDAFQVDNIPANILNKSYHLDNGLIAGGPQNQCDQEIEVSIGLKIMVKSFRDTTEGLEKAINYGETILKRAVNVKARTDSHPVKNVVFNQMQPLPLDAVENDNIILLQMDFTVLIILNPQDD